MDWQDELNNGLTKALSGLKTNEIPPEKAALELVFLDLNEEVEGADGACPEAGENL